MKKILLPVVGCSVLTGMLSNSKIRFLMRASALIWLSMAISFQLAAFNTNGQGLDNEITFELKHATLTEALRVLQNKTDIPMVYAPDLVKGYDDISLSKEKRTARVILDIILKATEISYVERDNAIVLRKRLKADLDASTQHSAISTSTPAFTVSGKITDDATGEALAGVNVLVKGTTRGTTSDVSGGYSIEVNENETLVYSFIGFKTLEILVGNRTSIDVLMPTDATALKEVQIISTNYFSTTKERSTMNIAKIEGDEISDQPVTSLLNSLVGRVPGLDITPRNGVAGDAPRIQIRGQNSLNANGSRPLYVIDGVQIDSNPLAGSVNASTGIDPLTTISPNNIESIEVLKDAAATAIYGSRGANGVIRITTKRAKQNSGKTNFDFTAYTGVGKLANKVDVLDRDQYLQMRHEAYSNFGMTPSVDLLITDITGVWDTTRLTDWQDVLLGGTANISDVQGGFSGGSEFTSFRLGGGYHKETTIYPGDFNYQRANADVSFTHKSRDNKFEASAGVNFGWMKRKGYNNGEFVDLALSLPPIAPKLYNDDGTLNWEVYPFFDGAFPYHTWTNPMRSLLYKNDNISTSTLANANLSYFIIDGLQAKTVVSLSSIGNEGVQTIPIASQPPISQPSETGTMRLNSNIRRSVMVEPQIVYNKAFSKHELNAIVGATWQQSRSIQKTFEGQGFSSDALLGTIKGASTILSGVDDNNQYRYVSLYAHIGYVYSGKYLIDLTGRRDGSSRFGPGKRYGNFGAISAGWIFSEESFLKGASILSFGKIRASYGLTGNDQIGDYKYLNTYNIFNPGYQDGVSLIPSALFNPNYAWETTRKFETAIELGFIKNRILIEASYYRHLSANQLIDYPLSATAGFPSVLANFNAVVQNTGLEVVLTTKNFTKDKFQWTTSINVTVPRNKLVEFDNIEGSPYETVYKVGQPLTIQRLYKYKGINSETGLYEVEDKDGDGNIDADDLFFSNALGRTSYFGVTNLITFANFDLTFLLQFSKSPILGQMFTNVPGVASNQPVEVFDRWQNAGDKTNFQKFVPDSDDNYQYVLASDRNIADASFVRLKTLSLGYRIPISVLDKIRLQSARLYLQGQNLITMTDYKGFDPETGYAMPPLRMINVGLQLTL